MATNLSDSPPDVSNPEVSYRLARAIECARAAGEVTLGYFQTDRFEVETKRDGTAVTTADRDAERLLRRLIAEAFPSDGIVGEEFGEHKGTSGYRWILDPIDGTASFVCGVPLYGTLVAVERGEEVVAGVIHMPALDEMVYAGVGGGAWHMAGKREPRRARVSGVKTLGEAVVCMTGWEYFAKTGREDVLPRLGAKSGKLRGWSDCYAHVLVATGRAEAVVEPLVQVWDVAPALVVMREAGGRFTDFQGQGCVRSGNGVLSNGPVHDEILQVVADSGGRNSQNRTYPETVERANSTDVARL